MTKTKRKDSSLEGYPLAKIEHKSSVIPRPQLTPQFFLKLSLMLFVIPVILILKIYLFPSVLIEQIFLIFFMYVLVVTVYLRWRFGLLSAVLSSLGIAYLHIMMYGHIEPLELLIQSLIYVAQVFILESVYRKYRLHDQNTRWYAKIFEQIPEPIVVTDPAGTIVLWNKGAERLYKYRAKEVCGKNVNEIVRKYNQEILATDTDAPLMDLHSAKDQTQLFVDVITQHMNLGDNYMLFMMHDVAKYKKREEELQNQVRAREEFLSFASHELRTPLTSLLLQLETVLRSIYRDPLANLNIERLLGLLKNAQNQSKRISDLIANLLDVSLFSGGRFELNLQEINISDKVKAIAEGFKEEAERADCTYEYKVDEDIMAHVDPVQIEQVVTNLISNAIKYGRGKPIHINLVKEHNKAILTVEDNGIGIDNEKIKDVFKPFTRLVKDPSYKGLGVGMYITSQIVEAHKGKIKIDSELGQGTTFRVELPI